MITKICTKCGDELPATTDYFHKSKLGKHGVKSYCKKCSNKDLKHGHYDERGLRRCSKCGGTFSPSLDYFNKDKNFDDGMEGVCRECCGYKFRVRIDPKDGYKFCTKCGAELPKTKDYFHYGKQAGWSGGCKECNNKQNREYHHANSDTVKAKAKKYYQEHKEEKLKYCKQYRSDNLEERKTVALQYYYNNKTEIHNKVKKRYHEDVQFNIECKVRGRIREAFKRRGISKSHKTIDLLGCSYQFYQSYLTVCFTEGMTWALYLSGDIVADHIKPIVLFDLTDEKQVLEGFNWMNTRPMWKNENESKNSFYQGKLHRRKPLSK
jgi:hypothetical protein